MSTVPVAGDDDGLLIERVEDLVIQPLGSARRPGLDRLDELAAASFRNMVGEPQR